MWGKETLELEEVTCTLLGFRQRKKVSNDSSHGECFGQN